MRDPSAFRDSDRANLAWHGLRMTLREGVPLAPPRGGVRARWRVRRAGIGAIYGLGTILAARSRRKFGMGIESRSPCAVTSTVSSQLPFCGSNHWTVYSPS